MAANRGIARLSYNNPAFTSDDVLLTHFHFCFQHREDYPGYAPLCKDPYTLLCGRCLAKEVNDEFATLFKMPSCAMREVRKDVSRQDALGLRDLP